jgi:hypothetical protein
MTTYEKYRNNFVASFEAAAKKVNPQGSNLYANYVDLNVDNLLPPVAMLMQPFTIAENRDRSGASAEMMVFFGMHDSFGDNEKQRADYVDEMIGLAMAFVEAFDEVSSFTQRSSQIRYVPAFKVSRDVLSGCACYFTAQTSGC